MTLEQQIVTDESMDLLYQRINLDYQENPNYIPTYEVHLAFLAGMRVSEISALKWECVTDNYILIDKSEKYDRPNKRRYIDKTKNQKIRTFPITGEIRKLLNMVKKVELEYGYISEWVFSNENGRVTSQMISSCMKNKCIQAQIPKRGIHALRKTINSKMR